MNQDHRRVRPLPLEVQQDLVLHPLQPATPASANSRLAGLEVVDSSFAAWLEAGGERRRKPRDNGPGKP